MSVPNVQSSKVHLLYSNQEIAMANGVEPTASFGCIPIGIHKLIGFNIQPIRIQIQITFYLFQIVQQIAHHNIVFMWIAHNFIRIGKYLKYRIHNHKTVKEYDSCRPMLSLRITRN